MKAFAVLLLVVGCAESEKNRHRQYEREIWEGPCHDESRLLATTAGSPDAMRCSNNLHVMQVHVTSLATKEEAAALVFCKCQRDSGPSEMHEANP
jgi:hypothetical protein